MVRTAGLEPARPYGLEILSLLRLPFRQVRIGVAGGECCQPDRAFVLRRVLACWAVAARGAVVGSCVALLSGPRAGRNRGVSASVLRRVCAA